MSFSEIILQNNNLNKTCHCCGKITVYYKKRLRITTVNTLKFIFTNYQEKIVTNVTLKKSLYKKVEPTVATEMFKHYALARHFGLLDIDSGFLQITEKGIQFLKGQIAIPEYIYGNRQVHYIAEEIGLQPAPLKFIHNYLYSDESDAGMHLQEAVAIPQL